MKKFVNFLKNYKTMLLLILAMIIGAVGGLIFKEDAMVVKPLGDLFLNLMFVIIVPLVFLTISLAVAKVKHPKRLGKIMVSTVIIFLVTSVIAVGIGFLSTYFVDLVDKGDTTSIKELFDGEVASDTDLNFLERTVQLISVDDFTGLLSKENVIALLVCALIVGFSMRMSKEKAEPLLKVMESMHSVVFNFIKITMYYAPIGIGCYFASYVGSFGASIATGFLKTFIYYALVALIYYIVMYTLYAFISGGTKAVKVWWKNILPSTFTALATCSSAACIPINIDSAKKMNVSEDVADTTISLATNLHQDGSMIGSVFKIMFLACLFGLNTSDPGTIGQILVTALVASVLISAVPIGGGTISEMVIISMMGFPVASLPVLTMVATVIDAPATALNAVGDTSCSLLVSRVVDGKNWVTNNKTNIEKKPKIFRISRGFERNKKTVHDFYYILHIYIVYFI